MMTMIPLHQTLLIMTKKLQKKMKNRNQLIKRKKMKIIMLKIKKKKRKKNWYLKPLDDQDEEVALITIDDAPDDHAVEMAHTLDDLDVPAIFFVNGHFIDDKEGEEKLKEIDELGFPIGNHTMTHPDLTTI